MDQDEKMNAILKVVERIESDVSTLKSDVADLKSVMIDERSLNNSRFVQLSSGIEDMRKEMSSMKVELKADINKNFSIHNDDLAAVVEDVSQLKRRVDKLERAST